MAKNQGTYKFGVEFNVNQSSLNNVKKALADLKKMSKADIEASGGKIGNYSSMAMKSKNNDLGAMRKEIDNLGKALEAAYNPKLNTYELNKFNQALEQSGSSAQRAFAVISDYGNAGKAALLDMTTNMLAVDRAAKQTNSTFQKLGETMMNTVRWSITSNALNTVTGAIQKAYYYTLDLDKSLNNIMVVTDKSSNEMQRFAREANTAAKALGKSTTEYTDASLIYYQQGLGDKDVKARTNVTLKAAAVTGQSAEAVSEQLTAVWNGYKVSAEESELYIDKLAAVAATTAADLEELSTGMSRVASAANIMGVDVDQLNAQLATIVSVTREAPESVGTALKTVYARMSDIEAGLDTETTLGEYTQQMAQMGINVLDANGKLRDMGAVVEEIGGKWNSLNREQQVSLAQSIAGTRQYSRMMALFDNWSMYEEALETSASAAGALSKQHLTYLDSIAASQENLKASAEGLYDSIFDSDQIKGVYNTLSGIVTLVDELVQSMGGMPGILSAVAMIFAKSAKNSIADLITKQQSNKLNQQLNKQQIANGKAFIENQMQQIKGSTDLENHLRQVLAFEKEIYEKSENLTDEQWQELQSGVRAYNEQVQETINLTLELQKIQEEDDAIKNSGTSVTMNARGRIATEIGANKYYLADEKDSKNSKGEKRLGLESAKKRQNQLHEKKLQGSLNEEEEKELRILNDKIPKAQKENEVRKKRIQTEQNYTSAKEKSIKRTEELAKAELDLVNKGNFANKITELTDKLTTSAFTIMTVTSSVGSLTETFKSGEGEIQDYFGGFMGLLMAFSPMLTQATQKAWAAGAAMKATGTAAQIAGAGIKAFFASFGVIGGVTIAITLLTSFITVLQKLKEAKIEELQKSIQIEKENQKEIQARIDLTKAYMSLYDTYKKTGEATDELKSSAEQIIDTLEAEGFAVKSLASDYNGLAKEVADYNVKKYQDQYSSAEIQANNALDLLESQNAADVKGVGRNAWDWAGTILHPLVLLTGGSMNFMRQIKEKNIDSSSTGTTEAEFKNQELLLKYLPKYAYRSPHSNEIALNWPTSGLEAYEFYHQLQQATLDGNWDRSSDNKIHQNVQKILADPELKEGYEGYSSAKDAMISSTINKSINSANGLAVNASSWDMTALRANIDTMVEEVRAIDPSLTYEDAKGKVEAEMKKVGGQAADLVRRSQEYDRYTGENGPFTANQDTLSLFNSMSNRVFNSLNLIDANDYKNDPTGFIKAVKSKLQTIDAESWASQKDTRLANLDNEIEENERAIEQTAAKNRAELLGDQNHLLQKQKTLLESVSLIEQQTLNTKNQELLAEVKKINQEGFDAKELQSKITSGDYDGAGDLIQLVDDADLRAVLMEKLAAAMVADNVYDTTLKEIRDKEDAQRANTIRAHEEEIAALEEVAAAYESIGEIMSSLVELSKEFNSETVQLNNVLKSMALGNINVAKNKFSTNLSYLQSLNPNDAEYAGAQQQALDSASAVIQSLNSYIQTLKDIQVNTFNSVFQASAKTGTGYGLEYINKSYEYYAEDAEKYLDNIEKARKIEALTSQMRTKISKMTNSSQIIMNNALQEELDILEQIGKLSQEDLDRAEKKLALLEAEIALEQAQKSTTMSLVRDASGTYRYQYTIDQAQIDAAEEEKRKRQEELEEIDKQAYQSNLSEFQSLYSSFASEYTSVSDPKTRELILNRTKEELQRIVKDNERLLQLMKERDPNFTGSTLQDWITSLATGENGINVLLADLEKATKDNNYTEVLSGISDDIATIENIISQIAEKEYNIIPENTAGMDTGGYTGTWGSSGKFLLAHEKELILNKTDTGNILDAVEIVRSLSFSGFNTAKAFANHFAILPQNIPQAPSAQNLEQHVSISAEFPNVSNRTEIEKAFDNILNMATQHAYQK